MVGECIVATMLVWGLILSINGRWNTSCRFA